MYFAPFGIKVLPAGYVIEVCCGGLFVVAGGVCCEGRLFAGWFSLGDFFTNSKYQTAQARMTTKITSNIFADPFWFIGLIVAKLMVDFDL